MLGRLLGRIGHLPSHLPGRLRPGMTGAPDG